MSKCLDIKRRKHGLTKINRAIIVCDKAPCHVHSNFHFLRHNWAVFCEIFGDDVNAEVEVPADSSVQVLIQIGKEEWREICWYYARQKDLPDFADITPDQFPDMFSKEHEIENESNHSAGEEIEEMGYADLMEPGSDCEDSGSDLMEYIRFELDINEMIKFYSNAKEDPGEIASGEQHFKGNFLCMFILRLYLRYTTPGIVYKSVFGDAKHVVNININLSI